MECTGKALGCQKPPCVSELQVRSSREVLAPGFLGSYTVHCASTSYHRAMLCKLRINNQACTRVKNQRVLLVRGSRELQVGGSSRKATREVHAFHTSEKVGQISSVPDSSVVGHNGRAASKDTCKGRVVQVITQAGIIACVKRENQDEALQAARAGLDGGVTVLEVTMTVPGALEVVRTLVEEYPDATIGVGTIYSLEEAEEAADVGARFVMSPIFNEEIAHAQESLNLIYIPGAMTPTEIWEAYRKGCQLVKVFPANEALLRALQRPLLRLTDPPLSLVASHGVREEDIQRYLGEKLADVVVLSNTIFGRNCDYDEIKGAAERVVALAQRKHTGTQ